MQWSWAMNSKLEDGMTKPLWKIWTWLSMQVCKARNLWKWAWGNNEWSFIKCITNSMLIMEMSIMNFISFLLWTCFEGTLEKKLNSRGFEQKMHYYKLMFHCPSFMDSIMLNNAKMNCQVFSKPINFNNIIGHVA
jgi:hypothetical protein